MSAVLAVPPWLSAIGAAQASLPGAAAWTALRGRALSALHSAGLPTARDDEFKYVNLRFLERRRLAPARPEPLDAAQLTQAVAPVAALFGAAARFVFVDGRYAPALSAAALPAGLSFAALAARITQQSPERLALETAAPADDNRLRLLATALVEDGGLIRLAAGERLVEPVHLLFLTTGAGSFPHVRLELGAGSALTLIEEHRSVGDGESFAVPVLSLELAENAELDHYRLQCSGPAAVLLEEASVVLARAARYAQQAFVLGAQLDRLNLEVRLAGEHAAARLCGLFLVDGSRGAHIRTRIEHLAPHSTSEQVYRGIAGGRARGSYDGKVVVHPGASKANSRQSSRNLLLSPEAEIDTRPQLEINTDDVACSHGATTGALDRDMLFYLLSRGLDPATARGLLMVAFAGDVLREVRLPKLREFLHDRVLGFLPAVDLLREVLS
jgi:Fe-S cluster assembly protein SufD